MYMFKGSLKMLVIGGEGHVTGEKAKRTRAGAWVRPARDFPGHRGREQSAPGAKGPFQKNHPSSPGLGLAQRRE